MTVKMDMRSEDYKWLPIETAASSDALLTPAEEIRLADIVAEGRAAQDRLDNGEHTYQQRRELETQICHAKSARDELVLRNQGLIGKVARRYYDTGLTFEDLMQEGQIGLIKAGNRYDPSLGTRFSTYAVWWIRQAIGRAVANTGRTIRLPVNLGQKMMRVRRTETQLSQELGRQATSSEIAHQLNWTLEQVETIHKVMIPVDRLEQIVGSGDEDDTELHELITDEMVQQPEKEVEYSLLAEDVSAALERLTASEASVLSMRYGLVDGEARPLSYLARKYGLSREGMRQVANRALDKIRCSQHAGSLRDYLD